MRRIVLFVILCCTGQVQAAIEHWRVEDGGNDHWYEAVFAEDGISWSDAKDAAVARGGHLATIASSAENDFVYDLISEPSFWYQFVVGVDGGPWLGGYQDLTALDYSEPNGGWRWTTGEPWVFTQWGNNAPDNKDGLVGGPEENLHYIRGITSNPAWNDLHPSRYPIKGYVAEWESNPEPNPVPEPTTLIVWSLLGMTSVCCYRRRIKA
jgi:hypothetical protein